MLGEGWSRRRLVEAFAAGEGTVSWWGLVDSSGIFFSLVVSGLDWWRLV